MNALACEDGFEALLRKLEQTIERYGVAVINTEVQVADATLSLAYTVGLAEAGYPEFLVFALPREVAMAILNNAADLARNYSLPCDTPIDRIANLPIVLKTVEPDKAAEYVRVANHRAGAKVPVLQLVWPDEAGRFPWDNGYDSALKAAQPALYASVH